MTPEEQTLELAKKSIEQVFEPCKDLVSDLLGPATTQFGLALGKYGRNKNQPFLPTIRPRSAESLIRHISFDVELHSDLAATADTMHDDEFSPTDMGDQFRMIRDVRPTLGGINGHGFRRRRSSRYC
jgi:hypothetical protein